MMMMMIIIIIIIMSLVRASESLPVLYVSYEMR